MKITSMRQIAPWLTLLLALLASLLGVSCRKEEKNAAAPGAASARGGGRGGGRGGRGALGAGVAYPVEVLPVEAKTLQYAVNAPGTLDAFERVQVTARVSGAVDKVYFTEGQQVKKGDVLVSIDGERYRVLVDSARASMEKAQASQKDVDAMIARREGATEKNPGLIPGEELETYRTRGLTARADVEVARASLRSAQLNLRDARVRAPMDGIIQTRTVETGQFVQAGYVMATLLRNDPMLLRFQVTPLEAARLKPGMLAEFRLRETLRVYTARISLVAGAADEQSHMVAVTAEVQDEEHKFFLRPGSFCDITVNFEANRQAISIPRAAVRPTDHGFTVYVVEGDTARERVLQLGMNTRDGWVEIRDGLKPGDRIVTRGAEPLSEGAKVRVQDATPQGSSSAAPAGSVPASPDAPATEGSTRRKRPRGAASGGAP
jgi:RND family efflux transporter MFP subunit